MTTTVVFMENAVFANVARTSLGESFLAAIQASLSVLLVISYGAIAGWLKLLTPANTKAISKICVQMFLPALLFDHIGSQLHIWSARNYLIVLIWALSCHLVSFLIGIIAHIWFGMPDWTTVALMFNNTTSYPLLLIAALDQTGILKTLLVVDETTAEALARAKSYFLVFATVSSCLTFAVGPRLIDSEHAPEESKTEAEYAPDSDSDGEANEDTGLLSDSGSHHDPFKQNSLFPSGRKMSVHQAAPPPVDRKAFLIPRNRWNRFSPRTKWWLLFFSDFFNTPLLGAILGAVVGLTPPLHRAFFNTAADGGIFTAWLTSSIRNVGSLFVPLPVLVAGVSLYTAATKSRDTGSQGVRLPWLTVIFVLGLRFILWPVISISVIYAFTSKTTILGTDPMLWFALMLMPTGPPAMKLITLVQVSDSGEEAEAVIAKLLTVSYIISPILSFTVVGALRVTQTVISAERH